MPWRQSVEPPTGSPLAFIYSQEFNYIHIQFKNQNDVLSILTIYCLIVQVARMITTYNPLIFNKQNLPDELLKLNKQNCHINCWKIPVGS